MPKGSVHAVIHFLFFSIAAEWRQPVIRLNSEVVGVSEVVVEPGTSLYLQCEGDRPVNWQTRLAKHRRFVSGGLGNIRNIWVERPSAEFTGTYRCFYTAGLQHPGLTSSVHVYVKGEIPSILSTDQ